MRRMTVVINAIMTVYQKTPSRGIWISSAGWKLLAESLVPIFDNLGILEEIVRVWAVWRNK
jgi:hypothetical protein